MASPQRDFGRQTKFGKSLKSAPLGSSQRPHAAGDIVDRYRFLRIIGISLSVKRNSCYRNRSSFSAPSLPMPLRFETARSARPSRRPNHGRGTASSHRDDDRADRRTRSPLRLRAGRNSPPDGSSAPRSETGRIVSDGRSCPEMAPQRLEKIKSGPGNGMVSEASKPLDVVLGRMADRALRLTKGGGSGVTRKISLLHGREIFLLAKH